MVIRSWTYQTAAHNATRFEEFEYEYGLPMMNGQRGCLEVKFYRRCPEESNTEIAEYSMISKWASWELLQAALDSKSWCDEVALFLSQNFGEGNGVIKHYDNIELKC